MTHKMWKANFSHEPITRCEQLIGPKMVFAWKNVTCRECLKFKPRKSTNRKGLQR